jgi:hypothetical protein
LSWPTQKKFPTLSKLLPIFLPKNIKIQYLG